MAMPEWSRVTETGLNPRRISITPLDPEKHDRASFSCGTVRLDNFLKRSARKHQSGDFTRVWVATEGGQDEIPGYYALNAHSLEGEGLPSSLTKHAPRSGSIPTAYLLEIGDRPRFLRFLCRLKRGLSPVFLGRDPRVVRPKPENGVFATYRDTDEPA